MFNHVRVCLFSEQRERGEVNQMAGIGGFWEERREKE